MSRFVRYQPWPQVEFPREECIFLADLSDGVAQIAAPVFPSLPAGAVELTAAQYVTERDRLRAVWTPLPPAIDAELNSIDVILGADPVTVTAAQARDLILAIGRRLRRNRAL